MSKLASVMLLIGVSLPTVAGADVPAPPVPSAWLVAEISSVGMIVFLGVFGMFLLYIKTYPSIDDIQRVLYGVLGDSPSAVDKSESVNPNSDFRILHNQISPLLSASPEHIHETLRHTVDAQNSAWNMYLQYTVAIILAFFIVMLIMIGRVNSDAGLPIIATIVGAAIVNAVQTNQSRSAEPRPNPTLPPQQPNSTTLQPNPTTLQSNTTTG